MATSIPLVADGEVIATAWGNQVRSEVNTLDVNKLEKSGGTLTGNVLIGGSPSAGAGVQLAANGTVSCSVVSPTALGTANINVARGGSPTSGATGVMIRFLRGASALDPQNIAVGAIAINGAGTGIEYQTTSDYRLKDVVGDLVDPLGRVLALVPRRLRWKTGGDEFDGFLAHEVADVVPAAVTGAKDAVLPADTDYGTPGDIDPQQFDAGKLVPLLVAAVQALSARVAALEGAG